MEQLKRIISDEEALAKANQLTPEDQHQVFTRQGQGARQFRPSSYRQASCPAMSPINHDDYLSHQAIQQNYRPAEDDELNIEHAPHAKAQKEVVLSVIEPTVSKDMSLTEILASMMSNPPSQSTPVARDRKEYDEEKYRGRGMFGRNYKRQQRQVV